MSPALLLAAITQAVPTPDSDGIDDIAGPEKLPWAWWQIALLVAVALLLLALAVWLVRRWRQRNQSPPLPPRATALRELERLRTQVRTLDPHLFSVAVSGVLRRFIRAQHGFCAERQTSSEFLAAIGQSSAFADEDRVLLTAFLERCDLVKFARIGADETTSEVLLCSAMAFVQGGRSELAADAGAQVKEARTAGHPSDAEKPLPIPRA